MMKKTFLILPAVLFFIGGLRWGQDSSRQPRVGKFTLAVRSVLSASIRQKGQHDDQGVTHEENETSDRITITYSETLKPDVWRIFEDGGFSFDTSPAKDSYSLAIEGGGSECGLKTAIYYGLVYRVSGSWSHKEPPLPEGFKDNDHFHLMDAALGGKYRIRIPHPVIEYPVITSSGTIESKDGSEPYKQGDRLGGQFRRQRTV